MKKKSVTRTLYWISFLALCTLSYQFYNRIRTLIENYDGGQPAQFFMELEKMMGALVLALTGLALMVFFFFHYIRQVKLRGKIQQSKQSMQQAIEERNRELQEKNDFNYTLINASQEWIAVWDKDLRLSMLNDTCAKMMNRTKEESLGKTLFELYPQSKGGKSENDLHRAFNGELVRNEPFFSPLAKTWVQNYLAPLRDKNGDVYTVLTIAQDVTEIITSRDELRKSQEHFSSLFQVSPVAKSLTRISDGTVLDVNSAWEKMFGKQREHVIGKNDLQIGLPSSEERAEMVRRIEENGGELHGVELRFHLNSGKTIDTYTSIVTIELDGDPCHLTAYFDISQRKAAEEQTKQTSRQLEKMNEALASFTYIASHDLQEPLRKIQTFSKRIRDEQHGNLSEKAKDYFGRIETSTSRMQKLIHDLLNYSRSTDNIKEFETIELSYLLEEVVDHLKEIITVSQATILPGILPTVRVIPYQMQQLLTNIIANAIKFAKPGRPPEIHITSTLYDAEISDEVPDLSKMKYHRISIADNGIGFDPTYNDRIFGLFQRLHGKSDYEGTGIGLAICKKIMENHLGTIIARGEIDGGAQFIFYIPIPEEPAEV